MISSTTVAKSHLEYHIGWSYKVLLTRATGTEKTAWVVPRQPRYQCLLRTRSLVWHQWAVSCDGDIQAAEELCKGLVLLWGLCALGLSFWGATWRATDGHAVLTGVAQPVPWPEPWACSGGEIAETSSEVAWTHQCRGLRVAHLCWNNVLKSVEWSNVPVRPTLKEACKAAGESPRLVCPCWPQGNTGRQRPLCTSFQTVTCRGAQTHPQAFSEVPFQLVMLPPASSLCWGTHAQSQLSTASQAAQWTASCSGGCWTAVSAMT